MSELNYRISYWNRKIGVEYEKLLKIRSLLLVYVFASTKKSLLGRCRDWTWLVLTQPHRCSAVWHSGESHYLEHSPLLLPFVCWAFVCDSYSYPGPFLLIFMKPSVTTVPKQIPFGQFPDWLMGQPLPLGLVSLTGDVSEIFHHSELRENRSHTF